MKSLEQDKEIKGLQSDVRQLKYWVGLLEDRLDDLIDIVKENIAIIKDMNK